MLLSYRCYKEDYIGLIKLTFHNDMKKGEVCSYLGKKNPRQEEQLEQVHLGSSCVWSIQERA